MVAAKYFRSGGKYETAVVLNVYDLTPMNKYIYLFGFGFFHSGIEVHGKEYAFGAHDFPISGIFEVEPRRCPGFVYRCSIPLGHVDMRPSEFRIFIQDMASSYHGNTYHLIYNNCNHFTNDVSWRLMYRRIPGWINRLAQLGSICSCLLPSSLQGNPINELVEYNEEDRMEFLSTLMLQDPNGKDDTGSEKHLLPIASSGVGVAFVKEASW